MNPAIILVSETRSEELLDEFGRYSRDYELPTAALGRTRRSSQRSGSSPRAVRSRCSSPSRGCPTPRCSQAFQWCAPTVPTARRVIAAHWSQLPRGRRGACAPALAKGKYDAYLLMPRGARDEEFHTAICELLSDWGSTVAAPEVVAACRIVSPADDALTLAIRDYLDRMGMPDLVHDPDSEIGREVLAHARR